MLLRLSEKGYVKISSVYPSMLQSGWICGGERWRTFGESFFQERWFVNIQTKNLIRNIFFLATPVEATILVISLWQATMKL